MKATLHRPTGRVRAALRRAARALRHVNDELLRACEAIIRSGRAPQARPRVDAAANGRADPDTVAQRADPDTGAERADRAA